MSAVADTSTGSNSVIFLLKRHGMRALEDGAAALASAAN